MKLYIKQKVFSWNNRFTVKDESDEDRYFIEGEFFSWGHKLHVYDRQNKEAAYIQQKVWSFLPKYQVFFEDRQVAEIVKEFTFFHPKYSISGLDWTVEGSVWAHDYQIYEAGRPIVTIQKEWFTWGDSYVLDIGNPQNEILALAVVITIDCVMADQAAQNNAT
ncbi:MAG: LURP-one-related family protein [Clostridiaceae bacterium]|nr:LURP-one-related family protein [Clostridiaceae bacterium]